MSKRNLWKTSDPDSTIEQNKIMRISVKASCGGICRRSNVDSDLMYNSVDMEYKI